MWSAGNMQKIGNGWGRGRGELTRHYRVMDPRRRSSVGISLNSPPPTPGSRSDTKDAALRTAVRGDFAATRLSTLTHYIVVGSSSHRSCEEHRRGKKKKLSSPRVPAKQGGIIMENTGVNVSCLYMMSFPKQMTLWDI